MSANAMHSVQYSFLSQPPSPATFAPKQSRQASEGQFHPVLLNLGIPSTTRRGSFSAIKSWAEQVAPGSPGSPKSILSRRGSAVSITLASSPRRPSAIIVSRRPSASFLNIQTPSTGGKSGFNEPADLTSLGYTNNFVYLPKTPETPEEFQVLAKLRKAAPTPEAPKSASVTKSFRNVFKGLRNRSKSTSGSDIAFELVTPQSQSPEPIPPVPAMPHQFKPAKTLKRGLNSLLVGKGQPGPDDIVDPEERERYRRELLAQEMHRRAAEASFFGGGTMSESKHAVAKKWSKQTKTHVDIPGVLEGDKAWRGDRREAIAERQVLLPTQAPASPAYSDYHNNNNSSSRRGSTTTLSSVGPRVLPADTHAHTLHLPSLGKNLPQRAASAQAYTKPVPTRRPNNLNLAHSNFALMNHPSAIPAQGFSDNFFPTPSA
ncbi:hypothetical protein DL96DRAFT_1677290 [Flagelloscypha sp. PMI_526]|nr:hypothetical protein DL96DRAFT_1677290 [Flagelloscypha sp. PMI_526]